MFLAERIGFQFTSNRIVDALISLPGGWVFGVAIGVQWGHEYLLKS